MTNAIIFEVIDRSGRKIQLMKDAWKHISIEHPELSNYLEHIQDTLKLPTKITDHSEDENIKYYYRYYKNRKSPAKYLLAVVKFLNGIGIIITAYFVRNIK